ncbi:MAG: aspartate carbamoyltransferase catalytic subunit [Acidobacteria bacterium]|nr:MAG: aspartate carbamoyltransferase catalytic subunit [Acidobacteriota bacterium]
MSAPPRHLLGTRGLPAERALEILETAESFREVSLRPIKKVPALRGKTVVNLFVEPSTRTRVSFELAAKRLSADAVNLSGSASSLRKGETLADTARTLEAMHPDVIVIRHPEPGAAHLLARHTRAAVVNAGDGTHEHPTQALLDAMTIRHHFGRLAGLKVVLVGDIAHSRVARSDIHLFRTLGAEVTVCGPPTLIPLGIEDLGVRVAYRIEEAVEGADVVMALRMQLERQRGGFVPSLAEYSRLFGLTAERIERMAPDGIVMHPGPMNRGIEIGGEVADGPRAVITEQVENGVAVRMAVLYLLAGADGG